jgi:hypothetical protein
MATAAEQQDPRSVDNFTDGPIFRVDKERTRANLFISARLEKTIIYGFQKSSQSCDL